MPSRWPSAISGVARRRIHPGDEDSPRPLGTCAFVVHSLTPDDRLGRKILRLPAVLRRDLPGSRACGARALLVERNRVRLARTRSRARATAGLLVLPLRSVATRTRPPVACGRLATWVLPRRLRRPHPPPTDETAVADAGRLARRDHRRPRRGRTWGAVVFEVVLNPRAVAPRRRDQPRLSARRRHLARTSSERSR